MRFRDFFRSPFNRGEPKEKDDQTQTPEKQPQSPQPPDQTAPGSSPQAAAGEQLPPVPAGPVTALALPPDHPMILLWSIYSNGNQGAPPPEPLLDLAPALRPVAGQDSSAPAVLREDELERELTNLEDFVSRTSRQLLARQVTDDEENGHSPDLDASVNVFLTARDMTAWLLIYPPCGQGAHVTREMLEEALNRARVCFGVDSALLECLPGATERYFTLFLAARGQPPEDGLDGTVEDMFSRNPTRTLTEDEAGRVDFAALELFQNAKKGDVICHIVPPTKGTDGKTVLGKVSSARPGAAAQVPKGRNTELAPNGEDLIATCDGHVEFSGRNFLVKSILEINGNVDYSTGNISALGDVRIRGDLCSGFTVRATGNVTVDGVVEAGTVEAGGDLIVRKGVQGNGQAVLRAYRSIYAKYLENSSAYARENIEAECVINCSVYSDGKITIRSGRGAIIGGQVHAADVISASIIGARSELQTQLFLGGRPCENFERESLLREVQNLTEELEKTSRQPDSPTKKQRMAKMRVQISADKMKLQQFDKEMEKLTDDPNARKGRMECGIVYPGAEITIDGAFLRVAHETQMCTATLYKGEVVLI